MVALSLAAAPGVARAEDAASVPEWAIDDGGDDQGEAGLTAQAELPAAYDLRNDGLVTPVKRQNPWGSCWSFGATAAAETSILSANGARYGYGANEIPLDLSEHHLANFAMRPITDADDPTHTQAGEGMYALSGSMDASEYLSAGGEPFHASTLFAMGAGPFVEDVFPYRGANAITLRSYLEADKEAAIRDYIKPNFVDLVGTDIQGYIAYLKETTSKDFTEEQAYEELYKTMLEDATNEDEYYKSTTGPSPTRAASAARARLCLPTATFCPTSERRTGGAPPSRRS